MSAVLESSAEGLSVIDPADWRVVWSNRAFLAWAAVARESEILFDWLPRMASRRGELEAVARGEKSEVWLSEGDSEALVARSIGRWVVLFVERPVVASNQRRDSLTGLADRATLLTKLQTLLAGERVGDRHCAVLFIDVDGFKQVNDAYGHLVGDRVLGEVARRLSGCIRARDLVARFGGDEFVVLLESVRGSEDFEPVAERLRSAFVRPIKFPDGEVQLAVSVGAAEAGPDTQTAEALINAADRAMYAAKRAAAKPT